MSPPVLLGKMTRREFRQRMQSGQLRACIITTAAIEQHLEHLAMEHDWRSVNVIAEAVALRLSPQVIVAQGVMAGVSEHHMTHAGTLTLRPGTFLAVVNDLIRSVVQSGFQHVLVLNGHGGNVVPCQSSWDQFLREFQINLHFLSYWDVLDDEDAGRLKSGDRRPEDVPGHAQEFETSMALARFPENVRRDALADQTDTRPRMATKELGEELIGLIVERVANYVRGMINGEHARPVPPFHP
jgi:creatinine amidohydrolase